MKRYARLEQLVRKFDISRITSVVNFDCLGFAQIFKTFILF